MDKKLEDKFNEVNGKIDPARIVMIEEKVTTIERTLEENSTKIKENADTLETVMTRIVRLERETEEKNNRQRNLIPQGGREGTSFRDIMTEQEKETGARRKNNKASANRNQTVRKNDNKSPRRNREQKDDRRKLKESEIRSDNNIINTCKIDVMSEARRKVGLYPIKEDDIREWIEVDGKCKPRCPC